MPDPVPPERRPSRPWFSSGPCAKRPGWTVEALRGAFVGRSHRDPSGKARLGEVIDRSRELLGLPSDWRLGIVPASDTGAVELAMWNLLGARGVTMLAWESFGRGWITDVQEQLRLPVVTTMTADYGELPDLGAVDFDTDVVFTWNGTTSGVRVPGGDWIPNERRGLTICDATSAAFAMRLPYDRLDVVTWSWQKVLGGEAAHGMLALSPRAVERLLTYAPDRPLPKLFRLTKRGALMEDVYAGSTINTPSMLAVEDALDGLKWAERIGGLDALVARSTRSLAAVADFVATRDWIDFLARDPLTRSPTSICLSLVDPAFTALDEDARWERVHALCGWLADERIAFDIAAYRDAPAGLRIWGGATVEPDDVALLLPWIEHAYRRTAR